MDVELQATCSALGYQEGNSYVKEPYCLETVKDLIRFLRRDTDTCEIRRQLGHAKIVENDLIPLIKGYHNDKTLFDAITKLLVNLTQPVVSVYNNEIPEEKTLKNFCLEIESHLQDTKEAFVDDVLFGIFADKIKDILRLDWERRREEDRLQLERLLILIRNVLMIPPDPEREQRTDDDATIHDQILWAAHTSGLEDLILYVASSDTERNTLCMHIMEIISLMFREHEVESLASAGVHRSVTEKEKDQKELEMAREKEKVQKKANVLKYSARHSRFGGTFVMKNVKSITEQEVIYHKPLCEVKSFSYDDGKNPKKKSKNLAPIKGNDNKRRSTLSMRLSLKEFCVQFLLNAYNPLMRAVKDALTHNSAEDNDETYYLWAMRYFMEFCRLSCKRVDLVSETMSMSAFHYIYVQLCTYYENSQLGKKEEAKIWGRRSHLALKAYQELLRTLDFMNRSSDEQLRGSAKVIQSNVFYMMEYRDIFVTLLKKFKESKQSRTYLRDLVESTHLFLKMLEAFTTVNRHLVVQKKGKKKRQKKKAGSAESSNAVTQPELSEEELLLLWEQEISTALPALLQGEEEEIPTDVSPFDAASETSEEVQKVETLSKIKTCLKEKRLGEATALLRASREIWPEHSQFGVSGEGWEEEMQALREIFMASIPFLPSQVLQQEEEQEDVNEALDDELGEETEEVTRNEQQFDFQMFVKEFAQPGIIKSYATLLAEFTENSDTVNHCIVRMFHRVCHDLGFVGMIFQASIFKTLCKLLNGPLAQLSRYKEMVKFSIWVMRQFTTAALVNKKIFVDILFWKSKNEALAITGDYDFAPQSKAKVAWSEADEEEVRYLYEKYRGKEELEMDAIDLIMGELTSSKKRIQVLKKLKELGLISSVKDLRKKTSKKVWTDAQNEELGLTFEAVKDSNDIVGSMMERLSFEKSKNSVVKQILALGLVSDKKVLYKRRARKGKKGRQGSEDDEDQSESESGSSDEGEPLFADENKRRHNRRRASDSEDGSDDDRDYREGDLETDDDDEDVQLIVRQSASSVGDYIARLVENGYRAQVDWIKQNLTTVAEDRDEGVYLPTPIVPLGEENETAMEDEIFLIFLRSLGFTAPVEGQEMFWRIPKELSASDLRAMADGITVDESGLSPGADVIQSIVSRVFPDASQSERKRSSQKESGGTRGKHDEAKRKRKKEKAKKKKKEHKKRSSKKASNNKPPNDSESDDDDMSLKHLAGSTVLYSNRKELDPDTSDSGLDPEIEAQEIERIRKEKEGEKGNKDKISAKKRKEALEYLMKKKNSKPKRHDRGGEKRDLSVSQSQPDKPLLSLSEGNDEIEKQDTGSQPSSVKIKTKKRVLESSSDEEEPREERTSETLNVENNTNVTGKKRMRIASSDESEDELNDAIISDQDVESSAVVLDESNPDAERKTDFHSQDPLDESLHLHFDESESNDEEDNNDDEKENVSSLNKAASGEPESKTIDSFQATLWTQELASDDEDDHVPLSTALKRKRAIIDDDESD